MKELKILVKCEAKNLDKEIKEATDFIEYLKTG